MREALSRLPLVLAIGGHDPGGGAGIQADIEAIAANGAHAATAITCLTVQDSCDVAELHPVDPGIIINQAEAVFGDAVVDVIKIGLLGSPAAARAVTGVLERHRGIPVVLDPVLAAGGGSNLAGEAMLQLLRETLIPLCDLITPNSLEARRLCGDSGATEEERALHLLAMGAGSVLITGTDEPGGGSEISHRLYQPGLPPQSSDWQRLPGEYHGSGCTLAAAIAARLAQGERLDEAVHHALSYSWLSLAHGLRTGRCQSIPDRLFRLVRGGLTEDE